MPNEHRNPTQDERDERVALPLDPETALRALLKVKPDDDEAADSEDADDDGLPRFQAGPEIEVDETRRPDWIVTGLVSHNNLGPGLIINEDVAVRSTGNRFFNNLGPDVDNAGEFDSTEDHFG